MLLTVGVVVSCDGSVLYDFLCVVCFCFFVFFVFFFFNDTATTEIYTE